MDHLKRPSNRKLDRFYDPIQVCPTRKRRSGVTKSRKRSPTEKSTSRSEVFLMVEIPSSRSPSDKYRNVLSSRISKLLLISTQIRLLWSAFSSFRSLSESSLRQSRCQRRKSPSRIRVKDKDKVHRPVERQPLQIQEHLPVYVASSGK
jgi:hypothetical protein